MAETTARIRLALEGQGQVVRGMKEVEASTASLKSSMAALAGGLSVGATVGQLVKVQREFDVMNSSLITMTGSSAAAQREMAWIKQFAATTPYGLNEVTGAFVKMKALGLDPSQKALTSYGNTASAMGKNLTQMIEAVADASTGEFERLKEFGIKASKSGDRVALTFQGVTTSIGNNAAEITEYLKRIGDVNFGGAMEARAKTLDGAISNLGDSWDELFRTVNEAGVGQLMNDSASTAAKALGGLSDGIRENTVQVQTLVGAVAGGALIATLPKLASGLGAVALGVRAIGLAMAANPLALALLGIGAVAGGAVAYDNAYRKTADGMRKTIEQMEEANRIAEQNMSGRAMRPEIVRDVNAAIAERTAKIKELKRALDAMQGDARAAFAASDPRRIEDYGQNFVADIGAGAGAGGGSSSGLNEQQKAEKEHAAWMFDMAKAEDVYRQKIFSDRLDAHDKLLVAAQEAYVADLANHSASAANAQQRLNDMQQEAEAIAYAETFQVSMARAVEMTTIARLKEKQVAMMGNEAAVLAIQQEIDAREQIVQAIASNDVREASKKLRDDQAAEWAKTWDQVGQSFTDALMQGGQSVKEYLKNLFRTLVLRPILAPIGGALGGAFGGTAAAGQAGGGGLGMLGSLQSAYNGISTGFSGIGASVGSIGASMQYGTTMFSQQSTMLAAQEAGMGTAAGTMGSAASMLGGAMVGFMAGKMISGGYSAIGKSGNAAVVAGTAIGALVGGPIGAAIGGAIGGTVNRLFGRKLKDSGLEGAFGAGDGFTGQNFEFYKGGTFRSDKTKYSDMDPAMQGALAGSYQAITAQTRAMAGVLGLAADSLDGFTSKVKLSFKGLNPEQIEAKLAEAFAGVADKQAELLLGTFETTLVKGFFGRRSKSITTWVAGEFVREGETAGEALRRLAGSLSLVNGVFDTLNTTLLQSTLAGGDAASKLIDAFGGADAFTAATSAYSQAFYTEAERMATTTRQLTTVLAGLGLQLPESRAAFRDLVESQDLYTDAGRATYAALLGLAPVFDQITQATQQMGQAMADEVRRLRGLLTGSSSTSMGALQTDFALATAAARAGNAGALERLPAISQALESAAALQAVTAADIARVRGQLTASLEATMQALGLQVPQFAVGTNYVPHDMLARIHEGEAIVPKAYNPAAGGQGMGNTLRLEAQLERVTAELEGLRAEVRAGVGHSATTAQILKRVTPNSTAIATEAAA